MSGAVFFNLPNQIQTGRDDKNASSSGFTRSCFVIHAMHLMACHECDFLQQIHSVPEGSAAICGRCGTELIRNKPKSFQRPLALFFAGFILFVMFNAFPLLTFKQGGLEHRTYVATGIHDLAHRCMPHLAALVAFNLLIALG